jgi:hypothetical protein
MPADQHRGADPSSSWTRCDFFPFILTFQPCYRRVILVKALMRGIGVMFLGAIVLGFAGCGSDNESDAMKAQNAGTPPPPAEGATATSTPQYKSLDDYAKSRKDPYAGTKNDPVKKK